MPMKRKDPANLTLIPSKVSRRSRRIQRLPRKKVGEAVSAGNLELVRKLLDSEPDLDPGNRSESSSDVGSDEPCLLQLAACQERLEVMQLLIERFGIAWSNAPAILRLACCQGALKVVEFCINTLKLDAHLGGVDIFPMHLACWNGHLDIVKFLAQVDPATVLAVSRSGRTAWHNAARQGHVAVLQYLFQLKQLQRPCRRWQCNTNQVNVLHFAAMGGHAAVVEFLLNSLPRRTAMIEVLRPDRFSQNALSYSTVTKSFETAKLLLDYVAAAADGLGMALLSAADVGSPEILQLLIDKGAPLAVTEGDGWTPLHYAAYNNHLAVVVAIVNAVKANQRGGGGRESETAQKAIINAKCTQGWTPLHYASGSGYLSIVQHLVEKAHADPNAHCDQRLTPLHRAAGRGRAAVCRYLVKEAGADPEFPDSGGLTALHRAAMHGSRETVEFLVKECGCDINRRASRGWAPLHFAADQGNLHVVEFLLDELTKTATTTAAGTATSAQCMSEELERPASPQPADTRGWTPLHNAAYEGHVRVVKCFLRNEAVDPATVDHASGTALYYAAGKGHCPVVKAFLKLVPAGIRPSILNARSSAGLTALHRAACRGHAGVVRLLLKESAVTARTRDEQGVSPLIGAAIHGCSQTVDLLLTQSDSDLLTQDSTGWNALHHAASCGHVDVVSSILQHAPMSVDERSALGWTPLHCSSYAGHLEVVRRLLQAEACPRLEDHKNDWTPLHYAAGNGHLDVVKILVEAKADPAHPGKNAFEPLHRAAGRGHIEVVRYLVLHAGADPRVRGWDGRTALHEAARNLTPTVLKFLLEHIASTQGLECAAEAVAACTAGNNSVLHEAIGRGASDRVNVLVEYAWRPRKFLLKKFVWHLTRHEIGRTVRSRLLQKICRMAAPSAPAVVEQPNEAGFTAAAKAISITTTRETGCLLGLLKTRVLVPVDDRTAGPHVTYSAARLLRLAATAWPCCPAKGPDAKCVCLHCIASGKCGKSNDGGRGHSLCAMFLLRAKAGVSELHLSSRFRGLATTPLQEAAARADMPMVRLLVAAKADPGVAPVKLNARLALFAGATASEKTVLQVKSLTLKAVLSSNPDFEVEDEEQEENSSKGGQLSGDTPFLECGTCDTGEHDTSSSSSSSCFSFSASSFSASSSSSDSDSDSELDSDSDSDSDFDLDYNPHYDIDMYNSGIQPCPQRLYTKIPGDFF